MDAPPAIDPIGRPAQYPASPDLLHRDRAFQFDGELLCPHAGRALPFEQLIAFKNHGGVENGYGKYSHFVCLLQLN